MVDLIGIEPRYPQPGRDHGNAQQTARASSHSCGVGCLYWLAPRRADRPAGQDIDFVNLLIHVRRSVVQMVDGSTKTEASAKDLPLGTELAQSLRHLRQNSLYNRNTEWVFASLRMKGKQPLWPDSLWKRYGKPAVKAAGITKRVSYHTFRHTFGTLPNANGENQKVVQELLRHATLKVTTDTYLQALAPEKREAQTKLVRMVLRRTATA